MKILVGFPDAAAWCRAAKYLGHEAAVLDSRNAVLQFDEFKPDAALVAHASVGGRRRTPTGEALRRHPDVKWVLLYQPGMEAELPRPFDLFAHPQNGFGGYWLRPYTTFLPDFPGGTRRDEFACDTLVCEPPAEDRFAAVDQWLAQGLRVKIFSPERWPYPQWLGPLAPPDLWDAFASGGLVANFDLSPTTELDVMACGGHPVPAEAVGMNLWPHEADRAAVLQNHTTVNRLQDILERLSPCP